VELDCIGTGMQPYNPIEHIVIIVKENHSFDNYFGSFPGVNGASLPPAQDPPAGGDPPHNHEAWLQRATRAVKLQYSEKDIPAYFSFASGQPVRTQPSDAHRSRLPDNR